MPCCTFQCSEQVLKSKENVGKSHTQDDLYTEEEVYGSLYDAINSLVFRGNGKKEYEEEVYETLYDVINSLVFRQQQGEYEEEEVYESLYDAINSLVFRQQQGGV